MIKVADNDMVKVYYISGGSPSLDDLPPLELEYEEL
jgi:hypothetical protein